MKITINYVLAAKKPSDKEKRYAKDMLKMSLRQR